HDYEICNVLLPSSLGLQDNLINDNTQINLNVNNHIDQNINYIENNNNTSNPDTTNNTRKDGEETSMGELLVCLSMINLK
ncbi:hypothetical protein PFLG_02853, partial [Plasmodium falciparum RAJ116]